MKEFFLGMVGATPVEWAAVILGLINVSLIIRRSIWNYPFGLVMVVLYAYIFYEYKLYSDALLQVYFFVIQIYGWWYWLNGRAGDGRIIVTRLPAKMIPVYGVIAVVGTAALGTVVARFTDADFPYWDATIATLR
jgi:nicotinamide mononucleotide transporter